MFGGFCFMGDVATKRKDEVVLAESGLRLSRSTPYDTMLDALAIMDKYIEVEEGVPVRVDRMTYIANFISKNVIKRKEEEVEEFDEEKGEMVQVVKEVEAIDPQVMKAMEVFLKMKPKEEKQDDSQAKKIDLLIALNMRRHGVEGLDSEGTDAYINSLLQKDRIITQ
jgi:microcompartment protein CcmL/EutN